MNIAHFETSMDWGGQELRIVEQTEWLNLHGHPTWIIARPGAAIIEKAREKQLPVFELRVRGSVHPATLQNLLHFLKQHHIQILDCHGSRDSVYGALVKALTRITVIRSRHVTDPIKTTGMHGIIWKYGNHGIITTAKKIQDMLEACSIPNQGKTLVAPAGVDPARFHATVDSFALRRQLGIPDDHLIIANIGMIRPDKGQNYYIDAVKLLLEKGLPITCIQVGEATKQTVEFKQQVLDAAQPYLGNQIQFLGYHNDIENYLALADIVVIASVATEAQTRLVSQAFFMQKNIVATTTGGLPEMITHEQTGLLCPPRDAIALAQAIERLVEQPELKAALQYNAYQYAQRFMTFDYMMQEMVNFYQHIADS
ncbi:MAG: glycosyltransferase family 4 protein [Plesiomonas sp.]|uniref:glycosyltransferase family 4 protein n=1 Tax=Plesiomonas sp. TaxID=2486279 RepID=UPI003F3A4E1E